MIAKPLREVELSVGIDAHAAIDIAQGVKKIGQSLQLAATQVVAEAILPNEPAAELHAETKLAAGPQGAVSGDQWERMVAAGIAKDLAINGCALGQVAQPARESSGLAVELIVSRGKRIGWHGWRLPFDVLLRGQP
jgi:hypothetical protein